MANTAAALSAQLLGAKGVTKEYVIKVAGTSHL